MISVVQMPFEASSSLRPKPEELHWGGGRNLWPISVLFCSPGLALALPNPSPPPPPQMDSRTSELQGGQRRTSKCANPSFLFLGWRPGFVCSKALPKRGQFELTPLSLGGTGRLAPGVELCSQLRSLPVWQGQTGPSNAKPLFEGTFSKPNLLGTLGGRFLLDKSNAAKFGLQFGARSGAYHDQAHWRLFPQVSAELGTHRWRATGTYASPNTCFSPSARSADPPKDEWIAGDLSLGMEVLTGRRSRIGLVGFRVQEAGPVRLEVLGPQHLARFSKPFGVEAEWAFGLTKGLNGLIKAGTESLFGPMASSKGTSGWMERLYIRFGLEWIWRSAAGERIGRSLWAHSPGLLSREVWSYAQQPDPKYNPPLLCRVGIEGHPELNLMKTSLGLAEGAIVRCLPVGQPACSRSVETEGGIVLSPSGLQLGQDFQLTEDGIDGCFEDGSVTFHLGADGIYCKRLGELLLGLSPETGLYIKNSESGIWLSPSELSMGPRDLEALKASPAVRLSSLDFDGRSGEGCLYIQDPAMDKACFQLLTPQRYLLKTQNGEASLSSVQRPLPEFQDQIPDVPELNFTLSNRTKDTYFSVAVSNHLEEAYRQQEPNIRTDRIEFADLGAKRFFGIGLNSDHVYKSCPDPEHAVCQYTYASNADGNGNLKLSAWDAPQLFFLSGAPVEDKREAEGADSRRNILMLSGEQCLHWLEGEHAVFSTSWQTGSRQWYN